MMLLGTPLMLLLFLLFPRLAPAVGAASRRAGRAQRPVGADAGRTGGRLALDSSLAFASASKGRRPARTSSTSGRC